MDDQQPTQTDPAKPPLPWDRQPGETPKAFSMFREYLAASPRSIRAAAAASEEFQSSERNWEDFSRKFGWVERAAKWDDYVAKLEDQARERGIEEQARQWADRREQLRRLEWSAGINMLGRAAAMTKPEHTDSAGRPQYTEKKGLSTAALLAENGSKLARRAAKMPVEIEEAAPLDIGSMLFESNGQIAARMPAGAAPEMPENVLQRPRVAEQAGTTVDANGREVRQPTRPPRPPR